MAQDPREPDRHPIPAGDEHDVRPEPDEPGEGPLTRRGRNARGFEVRITEDHGDRPLAEEMADELRGETPPELRHIRPENEEDR